MTASTINLSATLTVAAPRERLWPLISDTDRLNRQLGLPASEQVEFDKKLTRTIKGHYFGVPVTWYEYPFEWVFEQWYENARAFTPPIPFKSLVTRVDLVPLAEDQTRIDIQVRLEPRYAGLGSLASRLVVGRQMLSDMVRVYRSFGELAVAAGQVKPEPPRKPVVNNDRLKLGGERLRQFGPAPALIERLLAHLRSADDPEVLKMRPFALADAWGQDRMDVLRLFLYATRAGLLDLEWDVLCPNCRGPSVRAPTLADLAANAHCPACNIRYDVNFDESVELRFSVNPDIRDAVDMSFCVGGPANTRHIVSQIWIPRRGTKTIQLKLASGDYRLRSPQVPAWAQVHASGTTNTRATHVRFSESAVVVDAVELGSGEVALSLENTTDASILVILEQTAWSAQAVSAALVTALAEFRQLFSSQVLAPGLGVAVRNLTFLFSDLKGSTQLYDIVGDSPAYARVRDHFDVMIRIIARWRGALVKTIGDAVMAVFTSSEDAVEASLEIQREFTEGEIGKGDPALYVKLGLHRGPCIAVNANDLLDYFGSTVNIAARVQNESIGGDIVVTPEILSDPGVQRVIQREAPRIETFQRELKGFTKKERESTLFGPDGRAILYRLCVALPQEQALHTDQDSQSVSVDQ